MFREPILLETLERRVYSECSIRISDKQVIGLSKISEKGLFVFEDESNAISYSYFGLSTNNHICLCDSNEIRILLPNKTIYLEVPIAEMFHNYNEGKMVREYYDIDYTIKLHFGMTNSGLFIKRVEFVFIKQKTQAYTRLYNFIRKYIGK